MVDLGDNTIKRFFSNTHDNYIRSKNQHGGLTATQSHSLQLAQDPQSMVKQCHEGRFGSEGRIGMSGLPHIMTVPCTQQTKKIHPSPTCAFGIWYDIQIKVAANNNPVAEA